MEKPQGSVIILMEPDTIAEDEFNDWYDNEHIPQRTEVPGLLSIERFVCTDGWPRYLALYDWDTLDVLSGPEYKAIHHVSKRTPWSRRILGRVRGWVRKEAIQVHPGRARFGEKGTPARVMLARIVDLQDAHLKKFLEALQVHFAARPEVSQWRLFKSAGQERNEYWLVVEFRAVVTGATSGLMGISPESGSIDLINLYCKYWRAP